MSVMDIPYIYNIWRDHHGIYTHRAAGAALAIGPGGPGLRGLSGGAGHIQGDSGSAHGPPESAGAGTILGTADLHPCVLRQGPGTGRRGNAVSGGTHIAPPLQTALRRKSPPILPPAFMRGVPEGRGEARDFDTRKAPDFRPGPLSVFQ